VGWPNFLIIGACKAGTTSLHHYLAQHPQIFMSPLKEPKFFAYETTPLDVAGPGDRAANRRVVTDVDAYRRLFDGVGEESAVGEASCVYLYSESAPERIAHHIPDARLIAVLRDPVERAYSAYLHLVRMGRERLGFMEALDAEPERTRRGWNTFWHLRAGGFYARQLQRYLEHFDRSRLRIHLYDDLQSDETGVLCDIFDCLGVDGSFRPATGQRYQVSGVPWSRGLHTYLTTPRRMKSWVKPVLPRSLREYLERNIERIALRRPPPLPSGARALLVDGYRDDIRELERIIDRDLSAWIEVDR